MKKRAKVLITLFLSLLLLLINVVGNNNQVYAQGAHVIVPKPEIYVLVPGETTTFKIPIKAMGAQIYRPVFLIDTTDTPYTATQPVLHTESFSSPQETIYEYVEQYLEFDISVAESAKIGNYSFKISVFGTFYDDWNGETSIPNNDITINTKILEEKEEAQLTINSIEMDNPTIGQDMTLSFKIKNEGEISARNVFVSIDYAETGMIAGYSVKKAKIDDIASRKESAVSLPIKILPTAKPGIEILKVNLTHKDDSGVEVVESYDIYVKLNEKYNTPNLNLSEFNYIEASKPGDKLGLVLNFYNRGNSTAINPRIYVDESSIGTTKFIKDYYTEYIELKNVKADNSISAELPLIISKKNTGGEQELKLNLVYYDDDGIEYKSTVTIYLDIEAEGLTEDGTPIVIVSNVLQSPKQPKAGGRLEVSFDLQNKSAVDLNEFKLKLIDLIGSTFIPIESDPYQYIGTLKAGSTKRVTIPLNVSEDIPEGLSNLAINYSYIGGDDSINIPILDVKNDLKDLDSTSRPRLIVSKYESDVEELRAGAVFNLDFEIRNTHSSVAAKNIKLTVSGKSQNGQEVFTVTEGSNIFFVSKIGPGEIFSESLEMKVKSDTATGTYPINISIEYEYDGIKPNPTTGDIGEEEDNELNLQVVENARPVVDYVNVYSWDMGVTVGSPATMSFEFYNMGKSTLNNVVATVEGDFMSSGGSMQFMGNVVAGGNAYAEFEVIPNVEGMAYGVVKITYEDSNGEEQVYTKEFESSVMGEQVWNPDMNGDGGMEVFNPIVPEIKKAILPTWLFVAIQVVIFLVFLLISRKVIINIYKSKLRKKEEEMY